MLMRYILVNNNYINTNKVTKTYSQTDHSSSSRVENTSRDDSTSKNLDPDSKKMVLEHSQNAENLHKVNLTDNNDISSKKSSKGNFWSLLKEIARMKTYNIHFKIIMEMFIKYVNFEHSLKHLKSFRSHFRHKIF